jgi:hypothetical protein
VEVRCDGGSRRVDAGVRRRYKIQTGVGEKEAGQRGAAALVFKAESQAGCNAEDEFGDQ